MKMFKRFRDAATGLFTSKADAEARPAGTVAEQARPAQWVRERALLAKTMRQVVKPNQTTEERYNLLFNAVEIVIEDKA